MSSGSVRMAILFTDIEGSTRLLARAEDHYHQLLERHREILTEATESELGEIASLEGDASMAVFPDAGAAIRAARKAQTTLAREPWPQGLRVDVRMGVHVGQVTKTATGYIGIDVHHAARIAAAAHGRQLVASEPAVAQAGLGASDLVDLGLHRFKGFEAPLRVHQVLTVGNPTEFPRLTSLSARAHFLPSPATRMIGRDDETDRLNAMLETDRLVTILGPGGVGKTRLAVHVAGELIDRYEDGVWYVDLTKVRHASLVPGLFMDALGLEPDGTPEDVITEACRDRSMLLVVDNVEHVIDSATLLATIVANTTRVTILATSRERLRLTDERVFALEPLGPSAAELFVMRSSMAVPDLMLSDQDRTDIELICAAVDGLPLAIELTAATMGVLSPREIREHLGEGLSNMVGGGRDSPDRHRNINDTIAWSFDLLGESERLVFTRLAVFPSARPLEAIRFVCGDGLDSGVDAVLQSLVDKSLVKRRTTDDGHTRFAMLELVQQFAELRLAGSGEVQAIRHRQARHAADVAEDLGDSVWKPGVDAAFRLLHDQSANLLAAMLWAFDHEPSLAGRIAGGLTYFWFRDQPESDGERWTERALEIPGLPSSAMARLETGRAYRQYDRGDLVEAQDTWVRVLGHATNAGDAGLRVLATAGLAAAYVGDTERYDEMTALCESAIEEARDLGLPGIEAQALNMLGENVRVHGDYDRAERAYLAALDLASSLEDRRRECMLYSNLSYVAVHNGDARRALDMARKGISLSDQTYGIRASQTFDLCAGPLLQLGLPEDAARLFGAGMADIERIASHSQPGDLHEQHKVRLALEVTLGEKRSAELIENGRAMSRDEALRLALGLDG